MTFSGQPANQKKSTAATGHQLQAATVVRRAGNGTRQWHRCCRPALVGIQMPQLSVVGYHIDLRFAVTLFPWDMSAMLTFVRAVASIVKSASIATTSRLELCRLKRQRLTALQ